MYCRIRESDAKQFLVCNSTTHYISGGMQARDGIQTSKLTGFKTHAHLLTMSKQYRQPVDMLGAGGRTVAREPLAAALCRMVSPSWTAKQGS